MNNAGMRTKLRSLLENNSTTTVAVFLIVILYTLSILPISYFLSTQTTLNITEAVTILTPIGTILVSVLLAVLYFDMLHLQSQQVEIMDEQAGWAEAANSPALIIEDWLPKGDSAVFYLRNEGNSHVEEMNLIADLKIRDDYDGSTVDRYQCRSGLSRNDVDGFESRFLPAETHTYVYNAGVMFERDMNGAGYRFSKIDVLLDELAEDRNRSLKCELVLKLESVSPGGNVDVREFWRTRFGVFEGKTFQEIMDDGKWESRRLHVKPAESTTEYVI